MRWWSQPGRAVQKTKGRETTQLLVKPPRVRNTTERRTSIFRHNRATNKCCPQVNVTLRRLKPYSLHSESPTTAWCYDWPARPAPDARGCKCLPICIQIDRGRDPVSLRWIWKRGTKRGRQAEYGSRRAGPAPPPSCPAPPTPSSPPKGEAQEPPSEKPQDKAFASRGLWSSRGRGRIREAKQSKQH